MTTWDEVFTEIEKVRAEIEAFKEKLKEIEKNEFTDSS